VDSGAVTWWRWWRASAARDVVFALILTAVLVSGSAGEAHPSQPRDQIVSGHHIPHTPGAAFLLVAVATLVLAWRRRYPVAVLCISTTAVVSYSLLGYVNGAALLAPVVALYTVASRVSIRRAAGWAAVTLVVLMAATAAENPFGPFGGGFVTIPGLVAAASFGGIAVASRRAFVASIQTRADDEARRRIDEERLRIARELHDVVAHTMATINVQAGVAAHVAAERPDAAVDALQAIKLASKEGLRELRAILNVLRQADEPDSTQPAPGLAQLDALISSAERAGLRIAFTVTGNQRPLPAPADLAAYRIIQESLTNAIRHAGPATAAVSLGYAGTELVISVADTGRGLPADAAADGGGGHGLPGMRERAASVGGTVEAGPGAAGGFRVLARLPLAGQPATARPEPEPGPGPGPGPSEAAPGPRGTAPHPPEATLRSPEATPHPPEAAPHPPETAPYPPEATEGRPEPAPATEGSRP
jgi:signal transduction histidine kinase